MMDKSGVLILTNSVALILLTISMTCQQFSTMEKFEWLPSECALEKYPMTIIDGDFIYKDGHSIYIPSGKVAHNGWGNALSTHLVGEEFKPLPVKLFIHWFSYIENKFYEGTFDLPAEKIDSLFKAGLASPNGNGHITYDRIIVGVAPEGEVSVWLRAEAFVIFIANFSAKETETEWKTFYDSYNISRTDYIHNTLKRVLNEDQLFQLEKDGIPKGLLSTYNKQYPWKPEIDGSTPVYMWAKTYNGENEYFDFSLPESERINRAVPKAIKVQWRDAIGGEYMADIAFDEEEIIAVFKKLYDADPEDALQLQLEISESHYTVDVFVKNSEFIIKLDKNQIKVFSM